MGTNEDSGLLSVVLLNLGAMLAIVPAFFIMRSRRAREVSHDPMESRGLLDDNAFPSDQREDGEDRDPAAKRSNSAGLNPLREKEGEMPGLWRHLTRPDTDIIGRGQGSFHAVFFLAVVRCFLKITLACTVFNLAIVLPVLATGERHEIGFLGTTVDNISAGSWRVWVLLAAEVFATIVTHYFLARCTDEIETYKEEYMRPRARKTNTVHVTRLPRKARAADQGHEIAMYLECLYPAAGPLEAYAVPDLTHLHDLSEQREKAHNELERARVLQQAGKGPKDDTIQRLEETVSRLDARLRDESVEVAPPAASSGTGFVTFAREMDARQMVSDFNGGPGASRIGKLASSLRGSASGDSVAALEASLRAGEWHVTPANEPEDINWSRVGVHGLLRGWGQFLLVNLAVALVFIFFTTPIAIFSGLRELSHVPFLHAVVTRTESAAGGAGHVVFSVLPSLLLVGITCSMPYVFYVSSDLENHATRSGVEVSAMRKTYLFVVFNAIVMPGLVLTSLDGLFEAYRQHNGLADIVGHMFLIHGGVLFVSFMLTNALIGNGFDLLRLPSNAVRWLRRRRAVTRLDFKRADHMEPFLYAIEYGLVLGLLTMAVTLGPCCVLVLPASVIYFAGKYAVDKYHFMYTLPNEFVGDTRIVQMVRSRVVVAMIVSQFAVGCFFALKQVYVAAGLSFALCGCTVLYHLLRYARGALLMSEYSVKSIYARVGEEEGEDPRWREYAALYRHPLDTARRS